MFLKIGKLIVNSDFISHCIVDDDVGRVSIHLKSGVIFIFADRAEAYSKDGKEKGITYIPGEQLNSLRCYLRGDFSRSAA